MKSKFNPSQPFTCTCSKVKMTWFLSLVEPAVSEDTDRYNLCLVCRNKYRILFPNFLSFFFSQNKITEFLICLVKLKGAIKELGEIKEKIEEKVGRQLLLSGWTMAFKLRAEENVKGILKGCQMLGLSVRRL